MNNKLDNYPAHQASSEMPFKQNALLNAEFQALLQRQQSDAEALKELTKAASVYFNNYCQDEAADVEHCICGEEQHEEAKSLEAAIQKATTRLKCQ